MRFVYEGVPLGNEAGRGRLLLGGPSTLPFNSPLFMNIFQCLIPPFFLTLSFSWPMHILHTPVACIAVTRPSSKSGPSGTFTCGLVAIMSVRVRQSYASCWSGAPRTAHRSSPGRSHGEMSGYSSLIGAHHRFCHRFLLRLLECERVRHQGLILARIAQGVSA